MKKIQTKLLNVGDFCEVIRGTHAGKSGTIRDVKTSKTGHVTITVVQKDGERFKTLATNVLVKPRTGNKPSQRTAASRRKSIG